MTLSSRKRVLKIAVSAVTVFYGVVPALADWNETHLFNALWSEHARFHGVWFLAFSAGVAGTALFLIWRRNEILVPIVLGIMFTAGFWVATILRPAYCGELVDPNGHIHTFLGLETNMFLFSVMSLLLLAALGTSLSLLKEITSKDAI